MKITNEKHFYRSLWLFRYLRFLHFESDIEDPELQTIIRALNIKNRYQRLLFIVEEGCQYIDDYYAGCNLCVFVNNKCNCHRKLHKDYSNGCCRRCRYQSSLGCTTRNVACKLFLCTYAELNGKKRLGVKDIKLFRLLNFYQRYVISSDYFVKPNVVVVDLYVGPICMLIRLEFRIIGWFFYNKRRGAL